MGAPFGERGKAGVSSVARNKRMRWSCHGGGLGFSAHVRTTRVKGNGCCFAFYFPYFLSVISIVPYRFLFYTSFESMGVSNALETLPNSIKVVILFALAVPSVTILAWLLLTRKELKDSNSKFKFD